MLKVFRNKLIWLVTFINAIFPGMPLNRLEARLRGQRWPERHSIKYAIHVTPDLYEFKKRYYKPNHIDKSTGERVTDYVHITVPFVVTHRFMGAMIGEPGDLVYYCGKFSDGEVSLIALSKGIFDLHYETHYDNPDIDKSLEREIEAERKEQ